MKISLVQMDIVFGDVWANVEKVEGFVREAAERGSDLVVLPELWTTAYDLTRADLHAEHEPVVSKKMGELARECGVHIIGSMLAHRWEGVANLLMWHDPNGEKIAEYGKLHLFRLMDEEKYLVAGERAALVEVGDMKAGAAICYDLRFPELFRQYAFVGANVMIIPAEWPHPRLMHWRTLLQARAIENQCFVVACNRVGAVGETTFFGHSAVIDPWGERLIEGDETECLLTVDVDLGEVETVRRKIPVFDDRRDQADYVT